MGKGHYFGGGTLIGRGGKIGRAPVRGGSDCKASAEARRVAREKAAKALKKKIRKTERLLPKLEKLWLQERGKTHFQQLLEEQRAKNGLRPPQPETFESALAHALREAGLLPLEE